MKIQNNIIKYIFKNVYFINGTAYAGKSTMVKLLSEKHNGICCGENYHSILLKAIMLCPHSMSVDKFFEREDEEKQFILAQIKKAKDPQKAMANYKECLSKINSYDTYKAYENSGFFTMLRTPDRALSDALEMLEKHFML